MLEAIPTAHILQVEVIAPDYRMPPDHPFPAALDDALAYGVPESADAWHLVARFFDDRLGR